MRLWVDDRLKQEIELYRIDGVQEFADRIEIHRKFDPIISIPQPAFPSEEAKKQILTWIDDSR
ncbi:hypothetical protein BH11ARM1_BH11ARM1_01140 [soil metagenome]